MCKKKLTELVDFSRLAAINPEQRALVVEAQLLPSRRAFGVAQERADGLGRGSPRHLGSATMLVGRSSSSRVVSWMRLVMALSCLFLAAGSAAGGPPGPTPVTAALSKETAADLKALAAVDSFAVGGVGVAGMMSPGEKLTRAIAARPDAVAAFEQVAAGKNAAARVYAYWALRELDPDAKRVERLATDLRKDRAQVPAFSGCMSYESTVADLVAEIANGQRTTLVRRKAR
jgi:hypothetical protein